MRFFLIFIFIAVSFTVNAQDKKTELITDRPDQTESSAVVPRKALQIETGFLMENKLVESFDQKSLAYNTTLFRYGLLDNFELRLGLEYLGEKVSLNNTDATGSFSGFSPIYAGFKVKIADEDAWRPEIAFLGGLILPFTANDYFKPDHSTANIRFAISHTLSDRFSLGYNLGAEWDGETAVPGYFYSLALGIGLTDKSGMFIEGFGLLTEDNASEHLFDTGFTYLLLPNFQLDISGGIGLNDNAIDNFLSFGLTYRVPY